VTQDVTVFNPTLMPLHVQLFVGYSLNDTYFMGKNKKAWNVFANKADFSIDIMR